MAKLIDLTGQIVGDWTVLSRAANRVTHHGGKARSAARWNVRCACGKERVVVGYELKSGSSSGCGCRRIAKMIADNTKPNAGTFGLMSGYRCKASKRELAFELTDDDGHRLFTGDCHYCGATPAHEYKRRGKVLCLYNGIDRVDSTLGYTRSNCVSCCAMCNRMKSDFTCAEFIARCIRIADREVIHVAPR